MTDDQHKNPVQLDPDLEREIRAERKFSLAEAIGRLAGPGMMKGVSPVSRKQQAEAILQQFLESHLNCPTDELSVVLLRHLKDSEFLLDNLDSPLIVLAKFIQQTLASEYLLQELVREADVEWGRTYGERPHFQTEGSPPHPDDPYTVDSVQTILSHLLEQLASGKGIAASDTEPQ